MLEWLIFDDNINNLIANVVLYKKVKIKIIICNSFYVIPITICIYIYIYRYTFYCYITAFIILK